MMEVCFHRADGFYLLELPDDDDIEAHGRCNPGTVRVERLRVDATGAHVEVLWPKHADN